ncbi:MAG: alpha-galactosidase [Puniceicoccaceae bacterium]
MHPDAIALNSILLQKVIPNDSPPELSLLPESTHARVVPHREAVTGLPECGRQSYRATQASPLVQVRRSGEPFAGGFRSGITLIDSPTTMELRAVPSEEQDLLPQHPHAHIIVMETADRKLRVCQYLLPTPVPGTLRSLTRATNQSSEPIGLDLLSSFVLSGITPFAADDAPHRLRLHRFRSWWSHEGRPVSESIESLNLERSWEGFNTPTERFGQVGSQPVRQWFPFVAVEDTHARILWGAQLAWSGSWQIEITRRSDHLYVSGGLADYDFGHWRKYLQPGECLLSPEAHLACVEGTLEDLTDALVRLQEALLPPPPSREDGLPVIFNEWCTNWGSPSHDKTIALAKALEGSGVGYLVIDDGWAERPPEAKMQSNGDWIVDSDKFPYGMARLCEEIRQFGLIPGIWFEFEVCNPKSRSYLETDHLLQRDGLPLTVGSRRFWNLNDPWVQDFLERKLIHFLRDHHFGYLKVDYNDSIGLGCDHPDSYGEGLRLQTLASLSTFEKISREVPDLVIESCSSGGHRLEPSVMARSAMSSFSDAHETWHIPIIARQLHRLLPPRQSQIWAVLYPDDSVERQVYSLSATFLGRMCLSGPIHSLSASQTKLYREAIALYRRCVPLIREGRTHFIGQTPPSWNHPTGWQGIMRVSRCGSRALIVIHTFASPSSFQTLQCSLPATGNWRIAEALHDHLTAPACLDGSTLSWEDPTGFRGMVLLLESDPPSS